MGPRSPAGGPGDRLRSRRLRGRRREHLLARLRTGGGGLLFGRGLRLRRGGGLGGGRGGRGLHRRGRRLRLLRSSRRRRRQQERQRERRPAQRRRESAGSWRSPLFPRAEIGAPACTSASASEKARTTTTTTVPEPTSSSERERRRKRASSAIGSPISMRSPIAGLDRHESLPVSQEGGSAAGARRVSRQAAQHAPLLSIASASRLRTVSAPGTDPVPRADTFGPSPGPARRAQAGCPQGITAVGEPWYAPSGRAGGSPLPLRGDGMRRPCAPLAPTRNRPP